MAHRPLYKVELDTLMHHWGHELEASRRQEKEALCKQMHDGSWIRYLRDEHGNELSLKDPAVFGMLQSDYLIWNFLNYERNQQNRSAGCVGKRVQT